MTTRTDKSLKLVWSSIFRRKGRDGKHTRLFDNLGQTQQRTLLSELPLQPSELPVIGDVRDQRNWLLLTTRRLAWSTRGKRQEIIGQSIRYATADFFRLQREGLPMLDMDQLQITTKDNNKYCIELEPGAPLSGTWSVLNNLATRNRNEWMA